MRNGDLLVDVKLEGTNYVGRLIELQLVPAVNQPTEIIRRISSTGQFAISDVPAGRYILTVSARPYYSDIQKEIIIPEEPTVIELELEVSPSFLSGNGQGTMLYPTTSGGKEYRSVIEMMALLIAAEARGESYAGQVAVGTVIVNRAVTEGFPNTVADVMMQTTSPTSQVYQFTPIGDPSNFTRSKVGTHVYYTALQAAYDAIAGADPTGIDPLFFFAYKKVPSSHDMAKQAQQRGYVDIGNHRFFR